MRSQKIRLKPTRDQESLMRWYSKVSRNYWNLLVDIDKRNNQGEFDEILSKNENKTYYSKYYDREVYNLSQTDYLKLAKIVVTQNSEMDEEQWSWYYQPNQSFIYTFIARELVKIRRRNKGKLNFRKVGEIQPSFNIRCDISSDKKRPSRIYLKEDGKLQIPTLGEMSFGSVRKDFDLSCKKQVANISFDGKYWYLSYTEDVETQVVNLSEHTDGVGVDLGIKTLATFSDGTRVPNIKTFRRVRILKKRLKRLQRKVSRKYLINKCNKYNKTGMMKNKHLAKDIVNCSFYTIRDHIIRKATECNIVVRLVDRFYPSSKTCSNCGSYKKDLKLSQQVYHCNNCQKEIDRDLNAALNIAKTDKYTLA